MAGSFRALIVDDDPDLLALIRLTLEYMAGWQIFSASSAAEGLEIARDRVPDVVLVDLTMPEIDGYEFGRRLRLDPATAGVPLVLLTAHTELDKVRLADAGVAGVLFKPFQPETLAQQVREFCR
ncbi:MAG TPA: response regulator [Burkholderiales bacterium]|nr:response regulator [Burkholderiales bacterium]